MRAKPSHYYYLEIQSTFGFPSNVLCMCAGGKGGTGHWWTVHTHTNNKRLKRRGHIERDKLHKTTIHLYLEKSNAKTKNTPPLVINRIIHTHTHILPKKYNKRNSNSSIGCYSDERWGGQESRNAPPCNSNASQSRGLDIIITIISDCPYTI